MADRKHDIEKYLRGELSGEEMHALEKEALIDPFLAEALEGIEHTGADNFLYDLHAIRRSVHDRLRGHGRKKNRVIPVRVWTGAIAATLLLIAVSGFIVLSLMREQAARQQAMNAESEPMPAEFSQVDTLEIPLPGELPVTEKVNQQPRVRSTPVTDGFDQNPSLIAQLDDKTSERPSSNENEEQLAVNEKTDRKAPVDADESTDNLAQAERLEIPESEQGVPIKETESIAKASEESKRSTAGVQRPTKAAPSALSDVVLRGKVVDEAGQPLPGVNVSVKDTNIGAVTNADGQYQLRVPTGYGELVFSFIGFHSQEISIDGRQEVNVALNEDVTSLSEVIVVSGYGPAHDNTEVNSSFHPADPIGGRNAFKKYLESAVKNPAEAVANKVEGRVIVRFTVQADGRLTDFEVVKGIGFGAEDALINAIKSGPGWKPGMQGNQPITDQVKVRYRFRLPE